MQSPFVTPDTASVLVVEEGITVRQMLADVVRNLGFANVNSATPGKDLKHYLEVEKVDWLITPVGGGREINALQILKIISERRRLRDTKVSLLIDPEVDHRVLPLAFELGLMSFHPKSYVHDEVNDEFAQFLALLRSYQMNPTLVAAEYIRKFLHSAKFHKSRLALEKNLLSLFPGNVRVLYYLAEAKFLNDMPDKAVSILRQTELIDARMTEHCRRMQAKYLDSKNGEIKSHPFESKETASVLGIKSAIIIDPDTDVIFHITRLLKTAGVRDVVSFENGAAAMEWLAKADPKPDVIVMEWQIPGIGGPMLVQRIRQLGMHRTTIIVVSSLLRKDDSHLLREMSVDRNLEKPFEDRDFYAVLVWALQESRIPTEKKTLERNIRQYLAARNFTAAEHLIKSMLADSSVHQGNRLLIEAEYCFAREKYQQARDKGLQALQSGGDELLLLNLIGKAMIKLKQYDQALKCFEKASTISPVNIERLLNIAETNLYLEQNRGAASALAEAKLLDPTHPLIPGTEAKLRLEEGNTELAQALMMEMDSGRDLVSYMNNRAVSLSRAKRLDDARELYEKTLQSLPPKWRELRSAVSYNLALAHARNRDLVAARSELLKISYFPDPELEKKIKSLHKRIESAIRTETPLELTDPSASVDSFTKARYPIEDLFEKTEVLASLDDVTAKIDLKRGDLCCFLIFHCVEGIDSSAKSLLDNPPLLKDRSVIVHPETSLNHGPRMRRPS